MKERRRWVILPSHGAAPIQNSIHCTTQCGSCFVCCVWCRCCVIFLPPRIRSVAFHHHHHRHRRHHHHHIEKSAALSHYDAAAGGGAVGAAADPDECSRCCCCCCCCCCWRLLHHRSVWRCPASKSLRRTSSDPGANVHGTSSCVCAGGGAKAKASK